VMASEYVVDEPHASQDVAVVLWIARARMVAKRQERSIMVDRSRRCSWLTAADSFFPIGLFLIYQDSMLSYLINNGELYSTYKGGTPSTRGRSSNWPPPTPPPVTQDATLVISLDTLKLRLNAKRTVSHWDVRVSALLPVDSRLGLKVPHE